MNSLHIHSQSSSLRICSQIVFSSCSSDGDFVASKAISLLVKAPNQYRFTSILKYDILGGGKKSISTENHKLTTEEVNQIIESIDFRINTFDFASLVETLYCMELLKGKISGHQSKDDHVVQSIDHLSSEVFQKIYSFLNDDSNLHLVTPKYLALFLFSLVGGSSGQRNYAGDCRR